MTSTPFENAVMRSVQEAFDAMAIRVRGISAYSIIVQDLAGTIVFWNEGSRRLYRYDADETVGKVRSAILHTPEDLVAGKPEEMMAAALQEGRWEGTVERLTKDGRRLIACVAMRPRYSAAGTLIGFLQVSQVTPGEWPARQEQEPIAPTLLHVAPAEPPGLITVDAEGFITDINEYACIRAGRSRRELVGYPFVQFGLDSEAAAESARLTLNRGVVTNYELLSRTTTGQTTIASFEEVLRQEGDMRTPSGSASDDALSATSHMSGMAAEQASFCRALMEASPDATFLLSPAGVILEVNEQARQLMGGTRTDLVNVRLSNYFNAPERVQSGVHDALQGKRVCVDDLDLTTQQGLPLSVCVRAGRLLDSAGAVVGVIAGVRDLTGQKRLEQQLRDQQYYTRLQIESSNDALMATDPMGIITDVNAQMERLTGCPRSELVGSLFTAYFTDRLRAENGLQRVLREGKVVNYELTARARQGKETVVALNATTFIDQRGHLRGIFAAACDVTERKRAESHFRGLLESAPEAMVIMNREGRIVRVNSQTEKLFGYERPALLDQQVELLVPNCRQGNDGTVRPVNDSPAPGLQSDVQELFGKRKDGTEFPVEIGFSPLETEEGILVIRDITARRQVERAIQEKNVELEQASRAKDRFLASMSHELRTPLNAIIGFTGTLLMKLPGPLNDEQQDQLETVERSATHLLSLINDLLDLAKIESGKVELNLAPVSCQSVIDEVIEALKPMAEQKQLALISEIPHREVVVLTDRRALTQILLNLTTNALKFTRQGTVRISLAQDEGAITRISVADTGIGIRPEDQGRLFRAFQQLRKGDQDEQQGTGLGLQVSQKLAHLLGGQISFVTEPDLGSTFTLVIKEK